MDFDSLTLDDTTGNSLIDVISGKLTDAYNELQTYNVMLDSLISITQISSDVSSLARSSSSDLPETLDTQAGELAALQRFWMPIQFLPCQRFPLHFRKMYPLSAV